jgi:hypothetical protein
MLAFSPAADASVAAKKCTVDYQHIAASSYVLQAEGLDTHAETSVTHPRRHHHIARRRITVQGFVKEPTCAAPLQAIQQRLNVQGPFYYATFLRPPYYIFLFRYALF